MKKILGITILSFLATSVSHADAPPAHEASPDIYKVIKEDQNMRVIIGTWEPGQRDNWHSHPAMMSYRLTSCMGRIHNGNGKTKEFDKKDGMGALRNKRVKKHSFENIGKNECKILIVEQKN